MCTLSIILGSTRGIVTDGWKKFIWFERWESLSMLRGQSLGQLEDPKTSSPLRCDRQFMKDDMDV